MLDIPSDLFEKLKETPRPSVVVPCPRRDESGNPLFNIRLMLLTSEEDQAVLARARAETKKITKETTVDEESDLYRGILTGELLAVACRYEDNPKRRIFNTRSELLIFRSEEVYSLMQEYGKAKIKYGPDIHTLSDAELKEYVAAIKEQGANSSFFLDSLQAEALKQLLIYLVSQFQSSPSDTPSSGSPSDNLEMS